ncbi:hypothetical protein BDB00DRAFT_349854 [Zychaea mexicana]|uniref:uncharacterized protein n=1 Tax=Zychaea mexicana TaxID=64656 RepID=UPI0022FF0FBF|nr:uncharacterized protein BDB00DRAFT_349854 [Zychaea mexicana]KAI9493893.1 hypothetical protein BDB00DRAFT_349854 [Zychaea mexicana]
MDRAEYWRTTNDPHSPTHRSPEQPPRALADVGLEECGGAQNRYIRQMIQRYQESQAQEESHGPPGVRFQDDRGPGIRPGAMNFQDNYAATNNNNIAATTTTTTTTTTRAVEPQTPLYNEIYESTESSSSLSSPLSSSGKTARYRSFDELKFTYHGHQANEDEDDDDDEDDADDEENNSVVTPSTTKEEYQTTTRSALSSLNNNSAWGSVWDDYQPEYKLLHESYQSKKQDIFKDIEHTMEKLRLLEKNYEHAKDSFHNRLATDYKELCKGLVQKRNRIDKTKAEFEAAASAGNGNTHTHSHTHTHPSIPQNSNTHPIVG